MARRRGSSEVVTIYWRDIPTQVNGQSGRDRHQVMLSTKFQRAVDRARRKAGISTAHDDVAQWHRTSEPCDDPVTTAEAIAAAIEDRYSREHLGKLAFAGGFEADIDGSEVTGADLRALEEVDGDASEHDRLDEPFEEGIDD